MVLPVIVPETEYLNSILVNVKGCSCMRKTSINTFSYFICYIPYIHYIPYISQEFKKYS